MTDVLIYWRDFRKNAEGQITAWHSNAKLLGELLPGDRLWFVTSGKNLRQEAEQAGFLVAVWQVREVKENPGDDPAYPKADYSYRIIASDEVVLDEPVPCRSHPPTGGAGRRRRRLGGSCRGHASWTTRKYDCCGLRLAPEWP